MNVRSIPQIAAVFLDAVLTSNWQLAYACTAHIQINDLFRVFALLDPDDLNSLISKESKASEASGLASMNQEYAMQVVSEGKVYPVTQPGLDQALLSCANDYFDAVVRRKEIPLALTNDETGSLPLTCASTVALTADDYARAAQDLDVEAAALQAVAMTESGAAGGFGVDGRPTLRFELHVFQKLTRSRYSQTHPWLSQPTLGDGNTYHRPASQSREYALLYNAMILGSPARRLVSEAIQASSWGRFQVLGTSYDTLGWASPLTFARDMFKGEQQHLRAFVAYIRVNGLQGALSRRDWAAFARRYNGPQYAVNRYDTEMRRHYETLTGRIGAHNPVHRPVAPAQPRPVLR